MCFKQMWSISHTSFYRLRELPRDLRLQSPCLIGLLVRDVLWPSIDVRISVFFPYSNVPSGFPFCWKRTFFCPPILFLLCIHAMSNYITPCILFIIHALEAHPDPDKTLRHSYNGYIYVPPSPFSVSRNASLYTRGKICASIIKCTSAFSD